MQVINSKQVNLLLNKKLGILVLGVLVLGVWVLRVFCVLLRKRLLEIYLIVAEAKNWFFWHGYRVNFSILSDARSETTFHFSHFYASPVQFDLWKGQNIQSPIFINCAVVIFHRPVIIRSRDMRELIDYMLFVVEEGICGRLSSVYWTLTLSIQKKINILTYQNYISRVSKNTKK